MNYLTVFNVLTIIFILSACQKDGSTNERISNDAYSAQISPGLSHGVCQSPINILSKQVMHGTNHVLFNFEANIDKVENQGHTVQLDVVPGSTVNKDGEIYNFKQIHFHTPSEHHIDGVIYPMEMHIVHTHMDTLTMTNYYLVISMLFKMGEENEFINEFINYIPEKPHSEVGVKKGIINLKDMVKGLPKEEIESVYHYEGSLTTPPYSETVTWYVAKHVYEASQEQIEIIHHVEGDNARNIQEIGKRRVDTD